MRPTKLAQEVIDEINAASSLEEIEEIWEWPLTWLERDGTDDKYWIREALHSARKELVTGRRP